MKKTAVWAHRGASGYCPENTMPAFEKAVEMGADGIELDIQLTKDDQIVVLHDEWLNRTSDGKGWLKDYTLDELRKYNFNQTHPQMGRLEIPTVQQVFELIRPTDMVINIELKTGIVFYDRLEEKVLKLAKDMGMADRVIYSSFNHRTITRIHELDPGAQTGFLYADGTLNMPQYAQAHGVAALHPAVYNLQYPGFMDECRKLGIKVHVWTANEPEIIGLCCEYGVDAIITNYPDKAMEIVKQRGI